MPVLPRVVSEVTRSISSLPFGPGLGLSLVTCTCGSTAPLPAGEVQEKSWPPVESPAALGQDAKMGERQPPQSPGGKAAGNRQPLHPWQPHSPRDRLKHLPALAVPTHLHRQLLLRSKSLLEQQAVKGSSLWPSCSYQSSAR